MGEILLKPEELCQTAERIRTHARRIEQALCCVDQEIHRRIDGKFDGNQAEYFFYRYRMQRDTFLNAPRRLREFASTLDEIAARFRNADAQLLAKPRYGFISTIGEQGENVPYSARAAHITLVPPRDYALFSELAYSNNPELPQELKDAGWEYLGSAADFGMDKDGYFGAAFINPLTGEVVIAHRGTNSITDVDDDIQLALGKVPDQFEYSRQFTAAVQEKMDADPRFIDYTVVHTGHSLGAVLADLNALTDNASGITFENPGSLQIIANNPEQFSAGDRENLINYQSNPNLVHPSTRPLATESAGYTVQIVPEKASSLGLVYGTFTHHKLVNIIDSLSSDTGFPEGYFPPGAGDVNKGYHNLEHIDRAVEKGAARAPACYNPPPLPDAS